MGPLHQWAALSRHTETCVDTVAKGVRHAPRRSLRMFLCGGTARWPDERHPMKKTALAAALLATALLTTGCAAEAVTGSAAAQAAQGSAGEVAGPVNAMQAAKERIEARAYTARVVAEHTSMMAGQEWKVTGAGWTPGAAVTVTLTSEGGAAVGSPVPVVADAKGRIDTAITPPEGTATGPYTLVAADPADASGPHTAAVNVFSR